MWKIFAVVVFLSLSVVSLQAQHAREYYEAKWKKIDSLISKKGLIQSALQEVNSVFSYAKKENNDAQLIKALLYRMNLQEQKWEDAETINTEDLKKEIKNIGGPAKSILESILAETYWNYFQQNRWKLYSRTNTGNLKKDDLLTWSSDDFHKAISDLFLSSIKNERLLELTKLQAFEPIIVKGNTRNLRPTLFDLLAHRALDYFKNDEIDINKPAYAFEINNAEVFADKSVFAHFSFVSPDSLSLHFIALRLFQRLILFHLNDIQPEALLDVDIERIQFANQYGVFDNKQELYASALKNNTDKYGSEPAVAQAWFLQAQEYANEAAGYDPTVDTTHRFAYLQAKTICEKVLQQKDSSEGKSNCNNLLINILRKELNIQTEKINVPHQPFRTLVSYRNFTKLYFRIIKLDHLQKLTLTDNQWQNDYWEKLAGLPSAKVFAQLFPETGDFQVHRAEVKIESLPVGEYALLASVKEDFSTEENLLAVEYFYVSDIAYVNNGLDYFVLNRESGQPLGRTDVQFWYPYFDQQQKRYLERKGESIITDKNGFFKANPPKTSNNNSFRIEFTQADDHLFLDDELQSGYYRADDSHSHDNNKAEFERENLKTFLFTDRSIFRPGQTLFFKGIVTTKDFELRHSKTLGQFKTRVTLLDANNDVIDSVVLVTNEFGSYSGKFKLPENLLNGEFKITDDSTLSEQAFSVEEYQRPRFYVEFGKLQASYRINDSIKITGAAKGYAGNDLDGALVKYRVFREAHYPYPWLYWRGGYPGSHSQEMVHGVARTDAAGKFVIGFIAIPDKSIKKELEPVFEYSVMADITDINGETRSGTTIVPVAYQALHLSIDVQGQSHIPADSLKNVFVRTANLSGEFEPAKVTVLVYRLRSPYRLIRQRYWHQPDQFVMTREEYLKAFPMDEYKDESKKETWEKTEKVYELSDSSRRNGLPVFRQLPAVSGVSTFTPGWYVIEATAKDKYGQEVTNKEYIELMDSKSGMPPNPQYDWVSQFNSSAQPGEQAAFQIGSSANNIFVIEHVRKPSDGNQGISLEDTTFKYVFFTMSNEKRSFLIPVTEKDRGGILVNYAFVKDNRFFSGHKMVDVPWTNKELTIGYETFRDKTLPGSEEKWKIKVTGNKKEKVAAEVLTTMYDASLDQFKPHSWDKPDIYVSNDVYDEWDAGNNFLETECKQKDWTNIRYYNFAKTYDRFLDIYESRPIRMYSLTNKVARPAEQFKLRSELSVSQFRKSTPDSVNIDLLRSKSLGFVSASIKENSKGNHQDTVSKDSQFDIQIRKNFSETAFFFPDLKTDSSGDIEFSFTMPDAVTQWKWMCLAHTRDLALGFAEKNIVSQKQLMVQPNFPRFLREGDKLELSAKIVNLTDSELTGQTELQLFDATTNEPVDGLFINREANQYFTAEPKQSIAVNFSIDVPYLFNKPIICRILARAPLSRGEGSAHQVSDGEESTLPLLSNRVLVTESIPLNMQGAGTKSFKFEKLLQSGTSETLNHQSLTVEYSSNPAWYAVQALPYLMEYPYECAEQTFNRFYANAMAAKIVSGSPGIERVFEKWKLADTSSLLSNLQKNQELKSVLLEETPWVLQSKDERQQKKNLALLFDLVRMSSELESALNKLQTMQLPLGGFSWFKGGSDDRYITQYVLTGIGRIRKINALPASLTEKINPVLSAAISYSDQKIRADYDELLKNKSNLADNNLGTNQIQYLYMRSYFPGEAVPGETFAGMNYYRKQTQKFWLQQNKFMQAMIALSLFRTGDTKTANDILTSLKQNAIISDEMGMYWKDNTAGYYWHQSPIETASLILEAFHEIRHDEKSVNEIKTWLLKQKQTQNWKTTTATADACYAILSEGSDLLKENKSVQIGLGNSLISSPDDRPDAGPGYFKKIISGEKVRPEMGNINLTISSSVNQAVTNSWGAVYWQYFEDLDKITPSVTPLKLTKKLFVEKNTDRGVILEPVENNSTLKIGDKIMVRIELRADRSMEYIHMKDMRASCMEPVNVLSGYKWQEGLGYYESTKDASTNFFFSWLPKGTYVFEYPLFVTTAGEFSNGITSVQCMYAPEFTSNTEGIKVSVE